MIANFLVQSVMHETFQFRKIHKITHFPENSDFLGVFVEKEGKLRIPKARYQWQSALKTVKPFDISNGFQFPTEKS